MENRYPIHIPSKGRFYSNITVKALERMKVNNYWVIVEEQEFDQYSNAIGKDHLLVIDKKYQQYSRLLWRFGRAHHYVDYTPFKTNKLRRRNDVKITSSTNDYGLKLKKL